MITDSVLACQGPEVDHVGIIAVHHDPRVCYVYGQEGFRPEHPGFLVRPCGLPAPGQAVDEDNTDGRVGISILLWKIGVGGRV